MKNVKRIIESILASAALLLIITGCFNPLGSKQLQQAADGEGLFTLNIGGSNTARTILPPAMEQNNFTIYNLVFSSSGRDDIIAERTNANLGIAISLPAATWNLIITAYLDAEKTKPAARGNITGIVISPGGNTSRDLELRPIIESEAMGTFKWNIDYPGDVVSASMTITPLGDTPGTEQTLHFIGGTPTVNKNNSASPLALNTGYYRILFSLSNSVHNANREEYLHIYQNMESSFEFTFTPDHFAIQTIFIVDNFTDTSTSAATPGTLRFALANAQNGDIIRFSGVTAGASTIVLSSRLQVSRSVTIEGNGITLTPGAPWTISSTSQLMSISNFTTVNISRMRFSGGRATEGGAIVNLGTLTLESCIFDSNRASVNGGAHGGAIRGGTLIIKGCTFYNNSSNGPNWGYGGAIEATTISSTGNLFFGNIASSHWPVIYGNATSGGYNVVDVSLGTSNVSQSGWNGAIGDTTINSMPLSNISFKLTSNSGAANVITVLPDGYPTKDFYGNPIIGGVAASGAVQMAGNGFYLDLSWPTAPVRGTVNVSPTPDQDGFLNGTVTLTPNPTAGWKFDYWQVNGNNVGNTNPLVLDMTDSIIVRAFFVLDLVVSNYSVDNASTPGTLRFILANATNGDTIRFSEVIPGETTITLNSRLGIGRGVTIEGDGIVITRSASWQENENSQLLFVNSGELVTIRQVHFKDGRATLYGGAVRNEGNLVLESCIFTGNQVTTNHYGGTICNWTGTMIIRGCTFYNNSSTNVIFNSSTMILDGNLFYGNANTLLLAVTRMGGPAASTTRRYNVSEILLSTSDGNTTFSNLRISGVPINTSTFKPVNININIIPTDLENFPTTDFYGSTRTFPTAPGAVMF